MEALTGLLRELNDLKRQATPACASLAGKLFEDAWQRLLAGESATEAALAIAARAVAAARLGGIDEAVLEEAGLPSAEAKQVLGRSFEAVAQHIDPLLREKLLRALHGDATPFAQPLPGFVRQLANQPRAGATRPGRPRLMLLPAESHADHCAMVAIYSVLLGPRYGAETGKPFLAALYHHAHNAWLPDSGFSGEEMLGGHLPNILVTLRAKASAVLPPPLRDAMEEALAETHSTATPEARTFHAADVLDRVLQMSWYQQAAQFELKMAMEDLDLVHTGPVQEFHFTVLREAGLW